MLSSWWQMAMNSLCIVSLATKCASCSIAFYHKCGGIALVIGSCTCWHHLSVGGMLC